MVKNVGFNIAKNCNAFWKKMVNCCQNIERNKNLTYGKKQIQICFSDLNEETSETFIKLNNLKAHNIALKIALLN